MQRKETRKKFLMYLLCVMLTVATAFTTIGCASRGDSERIKKEESEVELTDLGEGETMFELIVADKKGKMTGYRIHTDKETVGDALEELKMIEGEKDQFGIYIKKVNGIEADYDKDKTYWALYINGEYAMSGVSQTKIEEGCRYSLRVESE